MGNETFYWYGLLSFAYCTPTIEVDYKLTAACCMCPRWSSLWRKALIPSWPSYSFRFSTITDSERVTNVESDTIWKKNCAKRKLNSRKFTKTSSC